MKVSNNKQSTNFNGTVRIIGFGYTDRADNIRKSISKLSSSIEKQNYDLFIKNNHSGTDVFVQKARDYANNKKPKKVFNLEQNDDNSIPKVAKNAIEAFKKGKNTSLRETIIKFFNK